jgi:hypothetical protein
MKGLILTLITMTLFFGLAASDATAQGRGHWGRESSWGKKCDKFVNCHDARDGRWDGRGPRRRENRDRIYWRSYGNGTYGNYRYRAYPTYRNRVYGTYRVRRPIRY